MNNSTQSASSHSQPFTQHHDSIRFHDYHRRHHPKGSPSTTYPATNHSSRRTYPRKVGVTANGVMVVDRFNSHSHLDPALLAEALGRVEMPAVPFAKLTVPMGRTIGVSICVETTASDLVVFAQRPGRQGLTRFVKNRAPIPC